MIQKYKKRQQIDLKLNILFRDKYDQNMLSYYSNNKHTIEWLKSKI